MLVFRGVCFLVLNQNGFSSDSHSKSGDLNDFIFNGRRCFFCGTWMSCICFNILIIDWNHFKIKTWMFIALRGLQANNETKTHKLHFQQENLAEICWKSLPQTTCEKRFSAPFYKLHASCVLKPTKSCNGISTNQYTAYTRRGLEFNEGQGPK